MLKKQGKIRQFLIPAFAFFLCFTSLAAWSIATPVGASPDENFHLASAWCSWGDTAELCESKPGEIGRWVPEKIAQSSCNAFSPESSANCQKLHPAGVVDGLIYFENGNYAHNLYPGLYYSVVRVFVDKNFSDSVLRIRLFNVALFSVLLFLIFSLTSRQKRWSIFWTWIATLVPLGMFMVSSLNPTSWAVIGVPMSFFALDAVLNARNSKEKIIGGFLFLIASVMASGARADGAVYVALAVVSALILNTKLLISRPKYLVLPIIAMIISALFFFSASQTSAVTSGMSGPLQAPWSFTQKIELLLNNIVQLPALWAGIFGMSGLGDPPVSIGNLGWLDTAVPMMVWLPALATFVAIGFVGLNKVNWRKIFSICLVVLALILLPVYVLQKSHAGVGSLVQPRYLLPLIILLLALLLYPPSGGAPVLPTLNRVQLAVVASSISISNSLALHYLIRRYVTGIDNHGWNLNENVEWWWGGTLFSPMLVWVIGSIAFVAATLLGIKSLGRINPKITH